MSHRPRPLTQSVGDNVADNNVIAFDIIISVAIVDVSAATVAANVVDVGAAVA